VSSRLFSILVEEGLEGVVAGWVVGGANGVSRRRSVRASTTGQSGRSIPPPTTSQRASNPASRTNPDRVRSIV